MSRSRRSSDRSSSSSSVRQRSILSSRNWTSASNSASRCSRSLSRCRSSRTRTSTASSEMGRAGAWATSSRRPSNKGMTEAACSGEISTRRTSGMGRMCSWSDMRVAALSGSPTRRRNTIPRVSVSAHFVLLPAMQSASGPRSRGARVHPRSYQGFSLGCERVRPSGLVLATQRLDSITGGAPLRILVAEDETIIRLDLRALLERAGFEVCAEARDGEEAVALARSERPDVAVLDVKMPKLDGIEAARRILDERPIPIVMLTAYGQDELVQRAAEAGVFGYLVKPFREQDLLPAIQTARARFEELAALREEAYSLSEALAARKVIERAKGLLMTKESLSEEEAFARLRKASQVSGRPLKVVAEAVVATLGEP